MHEFPGYQPWYLGGDEGYTYREAKALMDDLKRKADEARKEKQKNKGRRGRR